MSTDDEHLAALRALQTDKMRSALVEVYAAARGTDASTSDYPQHLRKVMDDAYKELVNAPVQSDDP